MPGETGGPLQRLALAIGWVSLGFGVALTLAPLRSAAFLGWGDREVPARVIGLADLIVGAGLLLDRRRSGWMLARAVLNAALAAVYALALAEETPPRTRARGGLVSMICLTTFDYSLSRLLRKAGAS
ncbi:hypothetical protein GBA63_12665 [Rubrobacter tropicus]|uniref:Uncharacterized protein n=1 Tax=Rubrobacter tropicus TaxID=2653851 RepID=A0A6G8QA73_9ACTN|nr:hypothetical protein [Rubrobacter tropicus]QIN83394.1 hypothetical protein GBA63_12665 [Rubrobacter tropicus]